MTGRQMIWRVYAILLVLAAHSLPAGTPSLTRTEAVKLADIEACGYFKIDLHDYEHTRVKHDLKEQRWFVGFRRKGDKGEEFAVYVFDRTRRAGVVIVN